MSDLYFKATDGMSATHGGSYRYPGLGRWTRHLDPDRLDPCSYGYHLARNEQILGWLAPTLWIAEPCPDHLPVEDGNKIVTCRVRLVERLVSWDDRSARLFAADCAEAVVHLTGPDARCVEAIRVARAFANGEATRTEVAAARDAASAAAWDAASAAAWAAAWDAAWAAAWAAARAAARDATRAATWDAAWDAQYRLLTDRLGIDDE